jgi:hypothetical protein
MKNGDNLKCLQGSSPRGGTVLAHPVFSFHLDFFCVRLLRYMLSSVLSLFPSLPPSLPPSPAARLLGCLHSHSSSTVDEERLSCQNCARAFRLSGATQQFPTLRLCLVNLKRSERCLSQATLQNNRQRSRRTRHRRAHTLIAFHRQHFWGVICGTIPMHCV